MLTLLILKNTTWKTAKLGCWKNSNVKRTWISYNSDSSLKVSWWFHQVPRCKMIHLSFYFNQHPLFANKILMTPIGKFALSTDKILRTPTSEFADVKATQCCLLKTCHCCFSLLNPHWRIYWWCPLNAFSMPTRWWGCPLADLMMTSHSMLFLMLSRLLVWQPPSIPLLFPPFVSWKERQSFSLDFWTPPL